MPLETIRVLFVEANRQEAGRARELLDRVPGRRFVVAWAGSPRQARAAAARGEYDALLLAGSGSAAGLRLLRDLVARGAPAPVILLAERENDETDLAAMRAGAADTL